MHACGGGGGAHRRAPARRPRPCPCPSCPSYRPYPSSRHPRLAAAVPRSTRRRPPRRSERRAAACRPPPGAARPPECLRTAARERARSDGCGEAMQAGALARAEGSRRARTLARLDGLLQAVGSQVAPAQARRRQKVVSSMDGGACGGARHCGAPIQFQRTAAALPTVVQLHRPRRSNQPAATSSAEGARRGAAHTTTKVLQTRQGKFFSGSCELSLYTPNLARHLSPTHPPAAQHRSVRWPVVHALAAPPCRRQPHCARPSRLPLK